MTPELPRPKCYLTLHCGAKEKVRPLDIFWNIHLIPSSSCRVPVFVIYQQTPLCHVDSDEDSMKQLVPHDCMKNLFATTHGEKNIRLTHHIYPRTVFGLQYLHWLCLDPNLYHNFFLQSMQVRPGSTTELQIDENLPGCFVYFDSI